MPTVQFEIDKIEIENVLKARRYAIHGQNVHGIQLTVADPTKRPFKFNGAPHRRILPGVSKEVYRTIRRASRDAEEAADRIEALSNGQEIDLGQMGAPAAPAPALSEATLERIVANRVDEIAAKRQAALDQREQELAAREAQAAVPEPEQAGKKRKGKGVKYERTEAQKAHAAKLAQMNKDRAAARAANEPVLTEEQKELAKKAGIPLA